MKPTCKSESDLFYRYLYFVFTPRLTRTVKDFDSDPMSGSIYLVTNGTHLGKTFDTVYCSPMWEGNTAEIEFEFHNEDGFQNRSSVKFPLNGWTMEVEKDVDRFVTTVWDFLKKNTVINSGDFGSN